MESKESNPTIAFRAGDMLPHLERLVDSGKYGNRSDIIQAGIWHMAQGFAGDFPLSSVQRIKSVADGLGVKACDLVDMLLDIHAKEIKRLSRRSRNG